MKTSLTKLIECIESIAITHESVRQKATELLEKEREQIEEYANQQHRSRTILQRNIDKLNQNKNE